MNVCVGELVRAVGWSLQKALWWSLTEQDILDSETTLFLKKGEKRQENDKINVFIQKLYTSTLFGLRTDELIFEG